MKVISFLLNSVLLVHYTNGQVPFLGSCRNIPPIALPNGLGPLSGNWFEAQRLFFLPEVAQSCIQASYNLNTPDHLDVQIRFTDAIGNQKVLLGRLDPIVANPAIDGRLQLQIDDLNRAPLVPFVKVSTTYPATVVFLDQDVMIKYSCINLKFFNFQSVWVLVRNPAFPAAIQQKVTAALATLSIPTTFLVNTNRNCQATLNGRSEFSENELTPNNATLTATE